MREEGRRGKLCREKDIEENNLKYTVQLKEDGLHM